MKDKILIVRVNKAQMEGAHAVTGCRCFTEFVDGKPSGYFVERKVAEEPAKTKVKRKRKPGGRDFIVTREHTIKWNNPKVRLTWRKSAKIRRVAEAARSLLSQGKARRGTVEDTLLGEVCNVAGEPYSYHQIQTAISNLITEGYIASV